jgi:hypothetical protein
VLCGISVIDTAELERYQRWLQSELAIASSIEDKMDRERRLLQIDIAISELVRYREVLSSLESTTSSPFVERKSAVREQSDADVKPITKTGECHSCGAEKISDLQFCPVCGEF